jgi:hypothetical protein
MKSMEEIRSDIRQHHKNNAIYRKNRRRDESRKVYQTSSHLVAL